MGNYAVGLDDLSAHLSRKETTRKLYQEVRDAYEEYFRVPVGKQQKKWARVVAARQALYDAKLPPFRENQWTKEAN